MSFVLQDPWLLLAALPLLPALWLRRRRGHPAVAFAPAALLGDAGGRGAEDRDGAGGREGAGERGGAGGREGAGAGRAGLGGGPLPRSWRVALLPLPRALMALGMLCAVVALARPARRELLPLRTLGIDVLLCLDASSSMGESDMDRRRTRLDVAKDAAARFVRGRPHDRIGLLAFARYPDVLCPPTLDHDALERILARVETVAGEGPEDATGIGTATARAAQVLRGSPGASKVVVLLTDGEENVATAGAEGEIAPSHAAQLCRALGVRVHAVAAGAGPGAAGGAGPGAPGGGALRRLAEGTGGAFFEARDAAAVQRVYERVDALEKTVLEEARYAVADAFLPFLAAVVALLLLGRVLESATGALP